VYAQTLSNDGGEIGQPLGLRPCWERSGEAVLGSRRGQLGQEFRQRGRVLEEVVEDGTEARNDCVAACVDVHLFIRH
jgi:hypothetical protein